MKKAWIAEDKDKVLCLHFLKPHRLEAIWYSDYHSIQLEKNVLPDGVCPNWEDEEPIEIELEIKAINKDG